MAVNNELNKYGVAKLNENNYHIWKQKMELWLIREDLWEVIEKPAPTPMNDDWAWKEKQAKAVIGLTVEDKFLTDIKHTRTGKEAWTKLTQVHQGDGIGARLMLYRKVLSAKFDRSKNMVDHIAGILSTASKLEDRGHKIVDEMLCAAILGSLPKEYSGLITSIEGRSAKDITIEYVREKVLEEYDRLKGNNDCEDIHSKALTVDTQRPSYNSKRTMSCYYCHKIGHIRRDCRLLSQQEAHRFDTKNSDKQDKRQASNIVQSYYTVHKEQRDEHMDNKEKQNQVDDQQSNIMAMSVTMDKNNSEANWIIDTGAVMHMCKNKNELQNLAKLKEAVFITTAGGENYQILEYGTTTLILMTDKGETMQLKLEKVYYAPELTENLISIAKLDEKGYEIVFKESKCWLKLGDKKMVLGHLHNQLYRHYKIDKNHKVNLCQHVWHQRLGHRNDSDINKVLTDETSDDICITECGNNNICDVCQIAKMSNVKFKHNVLTKATEPFEALHADLCGPISPMTVGNNNYALTIIDEYSKFATIYIIREKSQAGEKICEFIEQGINKFRRRPRIFRTDGGGEFCNYQLDSFFKTKGIKHVKTLPYTPQQNGICERHHRTLMDTTRALITQSRLPKNLWGELATTATYLINRVVHKNMDKTPYEAWHGNKPSLKSLRTIGTKCYYLNTYPFKKKLEDRGVSGILIGFGQSEKTYRIWNA